ncbi:hypothetical protein Sme01_37210 [Sphaerisporangium melleum]|uniref:DUF4192 domain-containing protein n=1 Tax=Sphaerisporangium melleum TaxID=321316 RepID=A0A917VP11_9ACTN|nr:DUF4192 domain-containing protein [Sphaerisporangium melleum]GGL00218.1 hypothetical protein GCM10007964_47870 [Sphaerisporangium melleum]GII71245.1 hypothetical protein Sme01_37210 [Sphaerisporangium melleum]
MTTTPILLTSPDDVLGAVPYLLGFHPADSLVVIAFAGRGARGRLRVTTRWDLPIPPGELDRLVPLLKQEEVTHTVLAGFGGGALVTPAIDQAMRLLADAGVTVIEALRAEGGRYWSYVCTRVECCPPEGRAYDPVAGEVAVQAAYDGLVALPDREALRGLVTPTTGAVREKMREATRSVAARLRAEFAAMADPLEIPGAFVAEGLARVRASPHTFRDSGALSDAEAARLGIDLCVIRIRDEVWALMQDDELDAHVGLWSDLTRRLEPAFVPPVASLLAAAAWRRGDSALAGIAVERALEADASYSMANLLAQGLRQLVNPEILRRRMPTSAELDAGMGPPRIEWLQPMLALIDDHALPPA